MKSFHSISQKIENWYKSPTNLFNLFGVHKDEWCFLFHYFLQHQEPFFANKNHLVICHNQEAADDFFRLLHSGSAEAVSNHAIYNFPEMDSSPYQDILSSDKDAYKRFHVLGDLVHEQNDNDSDQKKIIITTPKALCIKLPPILFFENYFLEIKPSDIIEPDELSAKLVQMGLEPVYSVEEPGTFAKRGEIFDIYPIGLHPVRIYYFDEMIEEIFEIDPESKRTLRHKPVEHLKVIPGPAIFTQSDNKQNEFKFSQNLRKNLPLPPSHFRGRFDKRNYLINEVSEGRLIPNLAHYVPLFFQETTTLFDYLKKGEFFSSFVEREEGIKNVEIFFENLQTEFENMNKDSDSDNPLPSPEHLFYSDIKRFTDQMALNVSAVEMNIHDHEINNYSMHLNFQKSVHFLKKNTFATSMDTHNLMENFISYLANDNGNANQEDVIITYKDQAHLNEMIKLLKANEEIPINLNNIEFLPFDLPEGLYYTNERKLVFSDNDFFGTKQTKTKKAKRKNIDLFAEQFSTLQENDYCVHQDYGIGQYKGLETITVSGGKADFLVLLYSDNDKVYVPVYKINLVQKYADHTQSIKLSGLRSKKFDQAKERAREAIKKLAFDLLKLNAKRAEATAYAFSTPNDYFFEFEKSFPFAETPDQLNAIQDVLDDMQENKPMDRLVCGDVGFGKTEVAMRAAFKCILDKKQVAILVPTTILALQHYHSFTKRFKNFPINIHFISRLKTPKEVALIKEQLKKGEVDIIIGTHKLLAGDVEFHDLGLVIVDEEQRFGVGHKEQLKLMKNNVDFLTLTATPIPRTMQLAFLGLRDLSLIQTAPPKRQSIKTYVMEYQPDTIKMAITKEMKRGGQIYFVHNRVKDIERVASDIKDLVPEAHIIIAHGQLPERELEKRMNIFYNGEAHILLCTTIIESGLDIPRANTLIINRADHMGLSQLHQLRGRIGRSDKKAYAYFMVPKFFYKNELAKKRLRAIQTYSDLGQGFSLASSDMEIRGAGDILGAEQSGHIEAIGLELYMDLLQEAIREIQGEKSQAIKTQHIDIQTPFESYIPTDYITDASTRLKYYKRLSNLKSLEEIENAQLEILDIYGPIPNETSNLFETLKIRLNLEKLGVQSLKMGPSKITLNFDQKFLETNPTLSQQIIQHVTNHPKRYQFRPESTVTYIPKKNVTISIGYLLQFTAELQKALLSP